MGSVVALRGSWSVAGLLEGGQGLRAASAGSFPVMNRGHIRGTGPRRLSVHFHKHRVPTPPVCILVLPQRLWAPRLTASASWRPEMQVRMEP